MTENYQHPDLKQARAEATAAGIIASVLVPQVVEAAQASETGCASMAGDLFGVPFSIYIASNQQTEE